MTLYLRLLVFLPLYHRAVLSLWQFPVPEWRNLYQRQTEFYLCLSPPFWRNQLQYKAGEWQFSECWWVKNLVEQYASSADLCPRAWPETICWSKVSHFTLMSANSSSSILCFGKEETSPHRWRLISMGLNRAVTSHSSWKAPCWIVQSGTVYNRCIWTWYHGLWRGR